MFEIIFYILIFLFIIRLLVSMGSMFFVFRWFSLNRNIKESKDHNFIVVIPVFKEQKIIDETVDYFINGIDYPLNRIKIVIVTTEKENNGQEKSTIDIVKNIKNIINSKLNNEIIIHLHYPKKSGKMVDQCNYAYDYILREFDGRKNMFVALYNADSRPDKNTFKIVSYLSSKKDNQRVFQQSAIFFKNIETLGTNFFSSYLLKASAVFQTRWTLAHEMPRFFRQSFFINKYHKRVFLAHCVGHGLFMRGDFLKEIKEMPSGTVTEDLFFGYILSLLPESINPIPVLEEADSPATIKSMLRQKYVWFFGPLDHIHYSSYFKNIYEKKFNTSSLLRNWFTVQGVIPAIIWFFQGWVILYLIMFPIVIQNYSLLALSLAIIIVYAPITFILVLNFYLKFEKGRLNSIKLKDYILIAVFSIPMSIIYSMPTIYSLYAKTRYHITGREPTKPKT